MSDGVEETIRWLNTLCCGEGEPPEDAKTVREWDRPNEPHRTGGYQFPPGWLICPACIRLRTSPVHLYYRAIGICDGENAC